MYGAGTKVTPPPMSAGPAACPGVPNSTISNAVSLPLGVGGKFELLER